MLECCCAWICETRYECMANFVRPFSLYKQNVAVLGYLSVMILIWWLGHELWVQKKKLCIHIIIEKLCLQTTQYNTIQYYNTQYLFSEIFQQMNSQMIEVHMWLRTTLYQILHVKATSRLELDLKYTCLLGIFQHSVFKRTSHQVKDRSAEASSKNAQ